MTVQAALSSLARRFVPASTASPQRRRNSSGTDQGRADRHPNASPDHATQTVKAQFGMNAAGSSPAYWWRSVGGERARLPGPRAALGPVPADAFLSQTQGGGR